MGGAPARVDGRLGLLEGTAVPARLRPGPDPRLQHEHDDARARGARPPLRPPAGSTYEDGRRAHGGAARAALPPDRLGARHDVPRGAADGTARAVLPDQGARDLERSRRGCARCCPPPCSTEVRRAGGARAEQLGSRSCVSHPCRSAVQPSSETAVHAPGRRAPADGREQSARRRDRVAGRRPPARSRHEVGTLSSQVRVLALRPWACWASCFPPAARAATSRDPRSAAAASRR